ncbi:MAG: Do family serine endopeptidase [Gemmatimonadaceae bacterium]
MTASVSTRAKIGGALAIAFLCGLVFASGLDLTRFGFAQGARPVARTASAIPVPAAIGDLNNAFTSIAESVTPSVVSIQAEKKATETARQPQQRRGTPPNFEDFFDQFDPRRQQQQPREASGSGFIVSKDGYILTNNHVVADFDLVTVHLTDHRAFKATVVGRDPSTDVAVIKIEGNNLPAVSLGNDDAVRIGEWVLAIGNPLGLDFTVTAGIVSAKGRGSRDLPSLNSDPYAVSDFIQTDAAINPGNSGGPLVNARGEVIGINSAIASQTGYYSGYGFAIPISLAKNVMDDIIAHGRVRRAVLGIRIQDVDPADAAVAGLKDISGVKVGGFSDESSTAEKAGMQPGDIIVRADGRPVDRVSTLQRIVRSHQPGDVVELEAMRYGQKKSFKIKLTEAKSEGSAVAKADNQPDVEPTGTTAEKLGLSLEPVSAEVARANRIPDNLRGLRVISVSANGAARNFLPGSDIIVEIMYPAPRRPVGSIADLQSALSKLKDGEYISLLVYDSRPNARQTRVENIRIGGRF